MKLKNLRIFARPHRDLVGAVAIAVVIILITWVFYAVNSAQSGRIADMTAGTPKLSNFEIEDNLKRDNALSESLSLFTDESKKLFCDAYVQSLKEQQLTVSSAVAEACKL